MASGMKVDKLEPIQANGGISLPGLLQLAVLLGLIVLAIHFLHIEESLRLGVLAPVLFFAFLANAFVPLPWRLPLLFLVNLAAIYLLLGFRDGAVLVGLGMVLFLLSNLPIRIGYRIGILLMAGGLLALFRAGWLPFVHGKVVLPLLGAMFMFRMVLYLYEMQFEQQPAPIWKKLSYFFLLPNLVFVIFPIVDYQVFVKSYYAKPAYETYRRGILMMANGVFHLLLYRLIYYYLLPAPDTVDSLASLLQYMAASYALIVRLAGIFHFSVGAICLFGFFLPPVFDHYFFANSFSDLWRRVNIYWRDFVTKVFYFPIYFRLKKYGTTLGMALSVLIVFAINWFLHGYQWFWIRGTFPITVQDITFWGVLGVLVAFNSAVQARRKPSRPRPGVFSAPYALRNALNIIAIFGTMAVLWSFWTSASPGDWLAMMASGRPKNLPELLKPVFAILLLAVVGVLVQYLAYMYRQRKLSWFAETGSGLWLATAGTAGLVLFGLPPVNEYLGKSSGLDLEPALYTKLNAYDREQLYKGYYESLMAPSNLNSRMWEMEQARPDEWKSLKDLGLRVDRDDILLKELAPGKRVKFKGGIFTTNSHGLRDREYSKEKPARTLRFALLGGSIEMGTGVDTDETYENLAENDLNASALLDKEKKVEILNFAIAGNHLFQNVAMCEWKASKFQPDVVVYTAHSNEVHRIFSSLYRDYSRRRELTYPFLKELVQRAGARPLDTEAEFIEKLEPFQEDILKWGLGRIRECASDVGAIPLWLYVPALDDNKVQGEDATLEKIARESGFFTLNLKDSYGAEAPESLKIASWDFHPNAHGHELIARELMRQLKGNEGLLEKLRGR